MDIDIINARDTKFTEAVSLSFHGVEEASFDLFHKVLFELFNKRAELLMKSKSRGKNSSIHLGNMASIFSKCSFFHIFLQFKVNQYPFQRRVIKAVQFMRETGRKVIEVRKNAMNKGEEVPDDILQHIIKQQGS